METFSRSQIFGWQYFLTENHFSRHDGVHGGADIADIHLYAPSCFQMLRADIQGVLAARRPLKSEYPLLHGSGTTTLAPMVDAAGSIMGIAATLEAHASSSGGAVPINPEIFSKVARAIPVDLVVFDAEHRFIFVGDQTVKDPEVRTWMIGKTEWDYCRLRNMPEELAHNRNLAFAECLAQQKEVQYEETMHREGKVLHKIRSFQPVYDEQGRVQFVMGFGHEITNVRESEHIIKRQHLAIESAIDGIGLLNKEGCFYYLNQAHAAIFGYSSPSELVGRSWKDLYDTEEVMRIETQIFPLLAAHGHWSGETTGVSKSGASVTQEINLTLLPDGDLVCICRDISEARRQADELKQLALVVQNTSSGVVITNADLEIEWVNNGFTAITGYTLEEVRGKRQSMLLHGSENQELSDIKALAIAGQPFRGELLDYTKTGAPCWISIKGQPIHDSDGKVVKYFTIQEDITYRKAMEQDLIVAKEAAEASARSKRRFLANMSHEIRTPMNAVMGLTAQLLKTELNDTQRFFAETIDTAARNLLTIINDILDISKIEEGKLQIECIEMSLREVLQRMHDVLEHKAQEKGICLSLEVAGDLPEKVLGDPYRLNQVLLNVVGNAIKFTEQGRVQVSCAVQSIEPGRRTIAIHIADTGIGMDAETLQHVFEEFFSQGDTSFVRKFGGTGLGLPISKSLVELMEGSLSVNSEKGRGTEVQIHIPFTLPDVLQLSEENTDAPDFSRLRHCRVLLVEDNKFNSLVAKLMLRNAGLEVSLAENGEEAVAAVSKQEFDIILMDIQMPVMDGVTATSQIRKQLFCDTPIIALTAHALREEKERYLSSGMNDFLTKPFQEQDLLNILHKWICKNKLLYV